MWMWIRSQGTVIPVDIVPPRHYFMECMDAAAVVWGIRLACVVLAVILLVIYRNMKKNSGE